MNYDGNKMTKLQGNNIKTYVCIWCLISERDANAFYESCEVKKMRNEELICKLRRENKQKRVDLAKCISVSIIGVMASNQTE